MDEVLRNLKKVQSHCVTILESIDKLCRENDIKYSLTGGSVIGAHLYQGIIPWDDDIDIMMTRDNYDKFLKLAEKALPPRYIIKNCENGRDKTILFSKVSDENTTIVELKSENKKVVSGIFVDITVMDKVPKKGIERKICFGLAKLLQCCRERNFEKVKSIINLKRNVVIFILKPFARIVYRAAIKFIKGIRCEEYDYAEILAGFTIPFEKTLFDCYTDVEFEGKKFMIVEDYMSYLETRYGKREFYKEQKKGDFPHHLIYVDCEHPYSKYTVDT